MDDLRWALLGLGLLFVGGLAWWEMRKPRHAARDGESRIDEAAEGGAASAPVHAGRRFEPRMDEGDEGGASAPAPEEALPSMRASREQRDPPVLVVDELARTDSPDGIGVVADVAVDAPGQAQSQDEDPWIDDDSLREAARPSAAAQAVDFDLGAAEDAPPAPPAPPAASAAPPAPAAPAPPAPPAAPRGPPEPEWPAEDQRRIVSLRVAPRPPNRFHGRTLRLAFQACGLEYGGLDIFHLADEQGRVFASAANLMRPGTFDLEQMDAQHFHGVHLFSVLPGPLPAGRAVDELIGLARDLAQRVNGIVLDEVGQPLGEERAAALRAGATGAERPG